MDKFCFWRWRIGKIQINGSCCSMIHLIQWVMGLGLRSFLQKAKLLRSLLYFECINNVSKYEACAMRIQAAVDVGIKKL